MKSRPDDDKAITFLRKQTAYKEQPSVESAHSGCYASRRSPDEREDVWPRTRDCKEPGDRLPFIDNVKANSAGEAIANLLVSLLGPA